MENIIKLLTQGIVWILIIIGGLCMLLSPVARYATGQDLYLWVFLGVSFFALITALAINKLFQTIA